MTLNNHFRLDIPPSSTLSQQSITINLPSTHYALQILPTISTNLSHRQYKLLVSVANARISPTPVKPEDTNPRRPIYDIRVLPGMNRVEVEMIAGTQRGAPKVGPGQDIEFEKVTIFVNLLRWYHTQVLFKVFDCYMPSPMSSPTWARPALSRFLLLDCIKIRGGMMACLSLEFVTVTLAWSTNHYDNSKILVETSLQMIVG